MSKPVFDKVDEALELQVIDWLQWYEFTQNDEVRLAALALELISKRKAAFAKLEASNKILREALEFYAVMRHPVYQERAKLALAEVDKLNVVSQANQEGES